MNFFKSVFSDDPLPPSSPHQQNDAVPGTPHDRSPAASDDFNSWSFGGLIKTLTSKSESVIQTYRRDLEEFGSGLKKETAVIRQVASRVVDDFPASLEVGASVAQESLESVGQAIDDIGSSVWKSTAEIISHGRNTLLADGNDSDSSDSVNTLSSNYYNKSQFNSGSSSLDLKRYSRFDAQVRALQCDAKTYLDEPEDLENYHEWKLGFVLDEKGEEIEGLLKENGVIQEIYEQFVPASIDREKFWSRYFFKLHKLKQAEEVRAKLVRRAISQDEEEDLSWDFDDDDEGEGEGNNGYEPKGNSSGNRVGEGSSAEVAAEGRENEINAGKNDRVIGSDLKSDGGSELEVKDGEKVASDVSECVSERGDKKEIKYDGKVAPGGKIDSSESCRDSDISVVSSQPSMPEEEDVGWDEIEDLGSNEESKGDAGGIANRIDLQERMSSVDQEEDLSWDIEDDDDDYPAKP